MSEVSAKERVELVGEKDGIRIYVRLTEPLDANNSKIVCEIENATATNVVFQLSGSDYKPPLVLRSFDSDGREIEKTEDWISEWEAGFQMHEWYGMIPTGEIASRYTIDLRDAFGEKWHQGVRIDVVWNADGHRSGPGIRRRFRSWGRFERFDKCFAETET